MVFVFGFSLSSSVALHVGFMYAVRGDLVFGNLHELMGYKHAL